MSSLRKKTFLSFYLFIKIHVSSHQYIDTLQSPITFSGLKTNKEVVFIVHNSSKYDSHFILSYLVENTEYPKLLAIGGNILQMYIKTCESKFIDSFCVLAMPLRKFSDTFNLPDVVKGTFPHCFNTPNNYGYVDLLPALHHYESDG